MELHKQKNLKAKNGKKNTKKIILKGNKIIKQLE